jgi:hypothetical protein
MISNDIVANHQVKEVINDGKRRETSIEVFFIDGSQWYVVDRWTDSKRPWSTDAN